MREQTPLLTTIAVGGYAAGQRLTGRYGWARVAVAPLPETPDWAPGFSPGDTVRVHIADYSEMALRFHHPNGAKEAFRFWVDPNTIKDEFDLMRELANGYRPAHQQKEFSK